MKAPLFLYRRPHDLDEALALLGDNAGGAQVLAGGQSLVPSLNMRLSSPDMLVDINRIEALRGIEERGREVRIGDFTFCPIIACRTASTSAEPACSTACTHMWNRI